MKDKNTRLRQGSGGQTKSPARLVKEEKVVELEKSFTQAKNLIFWDYSGLTVPQFQQLRQQLAQTQSKVTVAKNTLINFALKNSKLHVDDTGSSSLLEGPTAVLLASDEARSLKILANFIKNTGVGKLKFGFSNSNFLDADQLEYLATLPSQEEIIGQIANLLYTPIYNLTNVLEVNMRNLVYVLGARS